MNQKVGGSNPAGLTFSEALQIEVAEKVSSETSTGFFYVEKWETQKDQQDRGCKK